MSVLVLLSFIMVIGLAVVCGNWADVQKRRMKMKEREFELLGSRSAQEAAQSAAQIERLEQRVRVLERIVTDKGLLIADEIETLRAEPAAHLPQVN